MTENEYLDDRRVTLQSSQEHQMIDDEKIDPKTASQISTVSLI